MSDRSTQKYAYVHFGTVTLLAKFLWSLFIAHIKLHSVTERYSIAVYRSGFLLGYLLLSRLTNWDSKFNNAYGKAGFSSAHKYSHTLLRRGFRTTLTHRAGIGALAFSATRDVTRATMPTFFGCRRCERLGEFLRKVCYTTINHLQIVIMNSESSVIRVDNRTNNNFNAWKHKIELMLAFHDLNDVIEDEMPDSDVLDYSSWYRRNKKSTSLFVSTLYDLKLENFRECNSAKEIWKTHMRFLWKAFILT